MSIIYSGSALQGTGSLIDQELDSDISTLSNNAIIITNTGEPNYVTISVEGGSTGYFNSGSKLILTPFSNDAANGNVSETGIASVAGTTDGSYFGWTAGNNEYRFYVTSSSPLPSDNLIYKSPDNNKKLYNYYAEWSGTAGTLARNISDKINDINVDGLEELNAVFTNLGYLSLKTSIGTNKYNGVFIYRNTSPFLTMNHTGRNSYPSTGGSVVNGHAKTSFTSPNVPFVAEGTHVAFFVPNTNTVRNNSLQFTFAAVNGTIAANTFRVQAASGVDALSVDVRGRL